MGQEWQIFNLSKGITLPSLCDGSKFMEKYYSIYALIFLLQNDWRGDKIIMIGEYDEESKQYTDEFLSVYGLSYDGDESLVCLKYEDILPKAAYEEVVWTQRLKNIRDPFHRIQEILNDKKEVDKNDYLMTSTKKVLLKDMPTDDVYVFVNHTKKEYVKFDEEFFQGFYTTDYRNDMRKRIYMTLPKVNDIVKNIILTLISHKNPHSDLPRFFSGRFAGDSLEFMKESDFFLIQSQYTNIYHELSREDHYFQTYQKLEDVVGKKGWIMCSDHIQYDKDFFESDKEEEE